MRTSQIIGIFWLFLPLIVGTIFLLRRKRVSFWMPFLISSLIGYGLILAFAKVSDRELKASLYELDTNGDGVFTGDEITPEVNRRLMAVASDTGRTFAPFTGFPLSAIWTTINLGVLALGFYIFLQIKKKCPTKRST
ncbi:MAG: hypothetical protein IAE94_15440 [Chthoniobacterales bacterium]|nr:hypothetical protein [Chthoniobacterales bacterium]